MTPLNCKLSRELLGMRGQALAIGVVIASGVATLIMALTSLDALRETQAGFYRDHRFADVFVSLSRAPESLRERIADLPGVAHVETRISANATLEIEGFDGAAAGRLLSVPDGRNAELNSLFLRAGRLPRAHRADEAVVSESFADSHELGPGARLSAVINGRRQALTVVGVALSPEFVYQLRPGEILPDYRRYGILWMNRSALEAAQDLAGSFNDAVLTLQRDAVAGDVIAGVDRLLAPHGSVGAITREDQSSHRHISQELDQLATLARTIPAIFLGVAAFLLNVVVGRLVATQREQIGILKAFGYRPASIAWHYLKMVLAITALGLALGIVGGRWLGQEMAGLYAEFFRFPYLDYGLTPRAVLIATAVTLASALAGTLVAVRQAMRLPPAEAMRPQAPPAFRTTVIERLLARLQAGARAASGGLLTPPTRMMLRAIERRPLRAALSVTAMALAAAILMTGRYQENAIHHMVGVQFDFVQRDDLAVTFVEAMPYRALHELVSIPGVLAAEPLRTVVATLRSGHRDYRLALQGIEPDSRLRRLMDTDLRTVTLPTGGLLLTDHLAGVLEIGPGATLVVDVLEGRQPRLELPVAGIISEYLGVSAYLPRGELQAMLGEGDLISGALLLVEPGATARVVAALEARPAVLGITERRAAVDSFYDNMAGTVLIFSLITTILAGAIAFGVIYNNARIALADRARELASLRVLGYRRGEVGWILLGEQILLTVLALPPGFLLGYMLYAFIAGASDSDLYRVPVIPSVQALAFAAAIMGLAAALAAWAMRRRLDRLDLVAVLKSRE